MAIVPCSFTVVYPFLAPYFNAEDAFLPTIADSCIGLLLNLRIELLEITPARTYAIVSASH